MRSLISRLGKRVRIANRLALLMLVVSVFLLAIACFGAWRVRQLQERSEAILAMNVESIRAAVELEMHIQELRHQLDRYLWLHASKDSAGPGLSDLQLIQSQRAGIDVWLSRADQSAHTVEEKERIDEMRHGLDSFYSSIEESRRRDVGHERRAALAAQAEMILENQVLAPARRYLSIDESLLEESRDKAAAQSRELVRTLLYVGLFGAVVAMATGFSLARTIDKSLVQLRIPIQDVAGKLREVAGDVVVSTSLDLSDIGPALQRVSTEVASVVERIHAQHQELLHADQLATVGQLASGIAHEIRNPLMAMKLLVQTAQCQEVVALEPRDLQILDEEIRRLETLLTEFLDFARPTPLHRSLIDVRELADHTVSFLQRQADVRRVNLEWYSPSEPVMLDVDAPRIRQLLLNLLLNGIEMTPAGGSVRLSIDLPVSNSDRYCRIRIRDDGPGVSAENADRIFEPFYSTKETGLGLGLAVCQRIVRSHGGEISLVSDSAQGAEFVVVLPVPTTLGEGETVRAALSRY